MKHHWKKSILLSLLFVFCFANFTGDSVTRTMAQSTVTPTLYCLGSCPKITLSISTPPQNFGNGRYAQFPANKNSATGKGGSAIKTAISQSPCSTTQSVHATNYSHRKRNGSMSGFMQMLLQLLFQLLQMLFGGGSGGTPITFPFPSGTPGGSGGGSSPSIAPGISTTPCVATSTAPVASTAPSSAPAISTAPGASTAPSAAPSGAASAAQPNGNIPGPWTMTFNDEFTGTALDTTKWISDTKPGNNPDETSCFDPSTITESGGFLNMALNATPCQGKQYMGGQVHTKFSQAYGFYEARMNLLGSGGKTYNFPAFWIMPMTNDPCWPTGGEFDIMETISAGAEASYGMGTSCDNVSNGWPHAIPSGGDWTGWHTFAVDWETSGFTVYYDGKKVGNTVTAGGVSSTPMNVIVDQDSRPMGGETHTGTMQVDYVRVWKKQ